MNIQLFLLIIVVITALAFDFTNGFHDTGNAMATSIASGALKPKTAVLLSAVLNLVGAFMSTAVAATIAKGLIDSNIVTLELVFAGLVGGVVWNLLTWLLGIPSSSSHALIGGIVDVERTMVLNYYAPLRLIRGLAPGMIERGDGHIINVSTWGVLSEASPLFSVYNASKAALSTVSRVIETEWGERGVHSTALYYPLVATPMIAPTKAYEGVPALTPEEAGEWMITAARTRPVRGNPLSNAA